VFQSTRLIDRQTGVPVLASFVAQRLYEAYPSVDGLLYSSSMYGNAPAIALFERAQDCLPIRPVFHRELRDLVLDRIMRSTANAIGYGLV
jgi:hypothetical protein